MVVKIHESRPSVSGSLEYNERKVEAGKAEKVFLSKINDPDNPMSTFEIYERANIKTKLTSFHVSFNPGPTDKITEEETIRLIKDWMEEMGYADQPYIIYKHHDIERAHFHLVSTRVKLDGHRINNRQEYNCSKEALRKLSQKYKFTITYPDPKPTIRDKYTFDPEKGEVTAQLKAISKAVLGYHCTTKAQLTTIFEDYNVQLKFQAGKNGTTQLVFRGYGPKGRPCTNKITGEQLGLRPLDKIETKMSYYARHPKKADKARIERLANIASGKGYNLKMIEDFFRKTGISMHYRITNKNEIKDLIFIDHTSRCAYKAEELPNLFVEQMYVHIMKAHLSSPPLSKAERIAMRLCEDLIKAAIEIRNSDRGSRGQDQKYNEEAKRPKRTIYG